MQPDRVGAIARQPMRKLAHDAHIYANLLWGECKDGLHQIDAEKLLHHHIAALCLTACTSQ